MTRSYSRASPAQPAPPGSPCTTRRRRRRRPAPRSGPRTLCADVIFARFNNIKGAGVVALFREGVGQQGIALVVSDAGNTDLLRLVTVDGDPAKQGKVNALATVPLHNGIAENEGYRA